MLKRSKPMARGSSQLKRSQINPRKAEGKPKPAPMKEDYSLPYGKAAQLARPKRVDPLKDAAAREACRGQPCYLQIPGICCGPWRTDTTVPAHRNEGKGQGLKVSDLLTVPGCYWCHAEYDQGRLFTRDQKREFFNNAHARWLPVRRARIGR